MSIFNFPSKIQTKKVCIIHGKIRYTHYSSNEKRKEEFVKNVQSLLGYQSQCLECTRPLCGVFMQKSREKEMFLRKGRGGYRRGRGGTQQQCGQEKPTDL